MREGPEILGPYPGLRPFEPHETPIFFGREAHVSRLLEILRRERFLAVIGSSGSGKSSLVRAGMLPALYLGWTGGVSDWRIALMRPGDRPLRRLAEALLQPAALAAELGGGEPSAVPLLEAELRRGPHGLITAAGDALRVASAQRPFQLLLLVDQFEELFRYAQAGRERNDEAEAFVNLILQPRLEETPAARCIHVALTMRTDALHECARFLELPEAINAAQYLTPRLKPDELRRAIGEPARVFEGRIEPAVVTALVNAVIDQPDQLPILQHALARMWEHASARDARHPVVTEADIEATGGIAQALSIHADRVYAKLLPPQQALADRLFRAITAADEDGHRRDARRPQSLGEIARFAGREPGQWQDFVPVLRAFGAEGVHFLHFSEPLATDTVIDISHEALIRQWGRLGRLVAQEAEQAAQYRRWRDRCEQHERGGELLGGTDLQAALQWRDGAPAEGAADGRPAASAPGRAGEGWTALYTRYARAADHAAAACEVERVWAFLAASEARARAQDEARREAERQRQAEREQAARAELDRQRERADAQRRLARVGGAIAAVAIAAAVLATWQWQESRRLAQEAETARAEAVSNLELAVRRQREADEAREQAQRERERAERLQLSLETLQARNIATAPAAAAPAAAKADAPAAAARPPAASAAPPAVAGPPPAAAAVVLTPEALGRIMPALPAARRAEWATLLDRAMAEYDIGTPLRQAAFLAQVAHETGQLRWLEEPWGPTAQQERYEPPSTLATSLGNVERGDGERYRGRGLIWITGRANYQRFGQAVGVDLVTRPELAASPAIAARTAAWFWKSRGLNELADAGDIAAITRRLTGGLAGLAERTAIFERARTVLGG